MQLQDPPLRSWCRRRKCPTVALWAFVVVATHFATPPVDAEQAELRLPEYQKTNWQVEDGLPENNVRMIGQQPDGHLLLATSAGLATFDGLHFEPLRFADARDNEAVNAFYKDPDGTLWIGTDGRGVLCYRPGQGLVNFSERAGHPNERIRNFYRDSHGALWIATQNGVERFREGKLEAFTQAGMISGDITTPFAEDENGGLFFITSQGLFHFSGEHWAPYRIRNPALGRPVAVYRDPRHRLWVGTTEAVVQLTPRASGGYDEVLRARVSTGVTTMAGDAEGNLWVGSLHDGVRRIDDDGVDEWKSRDGLSDDSICSMFIDKQQGLWIGTQTGGLSRWRKGAFAVYHSIKGFHAMTAANVFADRHGDLWLGTWGEGLFRVHNGKMLNATPTGMPVATSIRALAENKHGQVWIGTWFDGVYQYDGQAFHHYLLGTESPGNAVSSIVVDRKGGLWIGTYIGLLYFPGGMPQGRRVLYLESRLITCLLEQKDGSILAGTNSGLVRISNGQEDVIGNLPNPYVLALVEDSSGYTWVSTKDGNLSVLRGSTVHPLGERSGLASLQVQTIVEDGDGDLWLGTLRGIVRIRIAALHDIADGRDTALAPVFFGRDDGLPSSECVGTSLPASTRMPDGTLWFVTAKGFVRTTDVAENPSRTEPVHVTVHWSLNDEPGADAVPGDKLVIAPSQPDLTFLFNVVDISNPHQIEFRYRLAGYNSDWTVTRGRTVRYRRLPPGNYQFEMQSRRSGEPWRPALSSIVVRQKSHIYQTWYAYLTMALLAVLIAVLFFRQRLQLAKGQIGIVLEERNRIARECHDTLMAGLAAVSWQLEATSTLFKKSGSTATPPAQACEVARSMLSQCQAEARRIIWDLRDAEEMTSNLSHALSRTISAHDGASPVKFELRVEGAEVALAPASVHHLVCIAQEAVNNALRHASASLVSIDLLYDDTALYLSIADNGCGLRSDGANAGHFGIAVMEERARKMGGALRVSNAESGGTKVSVSVPFRLFHKAFQQPEKSSAPLSLEGRSRT